MKLIVLEGIDGSGKKTQTDLLLEYLQEQGKSVARLSFPNYESPSSTLVKMYLGGEFGENASLINPYSASSFYAVDRVATFAQNPEILDCDYIIADRYTTSNMVHQGAKLSGDERNKFLKWIMDYEYKLMGIPRPDKVVFLDTSPEVSQKITIGREMKCGGKDIHEVDFEYMKACYECARFCAEKYEWLPVSCENNGEIFTLEEIHVKIIKDLILEGLL